MLHLTRHVKRGLPLTTEGFPVERVVNAGQANPGKVIYRIHKRCFVGGAIPLLVGVEISHDQHFSFFEKWLINPACFECLVNITDICSSRCPYCQQVEFTLRLDDQQKGR